MRSLYSIQNISARNVMKSRGEVFHLFGAKAYIQIVRFSRVSIAIYCMLLWIINCAFLSTNLSFGEEEGLPSVNQILHGVEGRLAKIRNSYEAAFWEEWGYRETGAKTEFCKIRWEYNKIYSDDLGRFKVFQKKGSFNSKNERVPDDEAERYVLYDGEKTIVYSYFPKWDRRGIPIKGDIKNRSNNTLKLGYRRASIFDGMYPRSGGPRGHTRYALMFMKSHERVKKSLSRATEIKVIPHTDWKGIYDLELYLPEPTTLDQASIKMTVDATRDWIVTRGEQRVKARGRGTESWCSYEKATEDFWLPKKGCMKEWENWYDLPMNRKLRREVTFSVEEAKVNDPNFPPNVFEVILEPDTAVSDLRYHVDYRVGEEAVVDAKLKSLAERALAEETQAEKELLKRHANPIKPWLRLMLVVSTVVLVTILILRMLLSLYLWRRSS